MFMIYSKGIPMGEERTFQFAQNVRIFVKKLHNPDKLEIINIKLQIPNTNDMKHY